MTTDPQRPEVDDPRVLALAKARQQLAYDNPFNAVCPPWDGLSEKEQHLSLLDARSYLHAAMKAGLVPAVSAPPPPPATRADILRELEQRYREHARNSVHPDFGAAYAAVANDLSRLADEEQPECSASLSGRCLRESQSETACDTDAGECVHGGRPAAEEQPDTEAPADPIGISRELCPGFPDRCPNLRTVEPEPGVHLGGVRCGCADAPAPVAQQSAADVLTPIGGVKGNPFDYHPEDEQQPAAADTDEEPQP